MKSEILLPGVMIATMMTAAGVSMSAQAAGRGRVLVIVSSENEMALQGGKYYPTGFYLNELTVPVRAVMEDGYDVTFANPKGNPPTMDEHSDSAKYFGGDVAKFQDYRRFLDSLTGLKNPRKISDVIAEGLDQYSAVFFPGGHAPMIDLLEDPGVGTVLKHFHAENKPTALICHGPISLLAALPNAVEVVGALRSGDADRAKELAGLQWIYDGYRMTIFSTAEEQVAEAGQLGGKVLFYPDVALRAAGGDMSIAQPWASNAIRDRELITGQNPYSDEALAGLLVQALEEKAK